MASTLSPSRAQAFSSTFTAEARFAIAGNAPPDLLLLSAGDVVFYVHAAVLRRASGNHFGGLLARGAPAPAPLRVPEDTPTLTVVLCTAYGLPLPDAPDWAALSGALSASARCGLPPLSGAEALHGALLAHAHRPGGAREVFALAAAHGAEPLAVAASEHLLSLDLSTLDDAFARAVGAVYLRRLFFLHLGRVAALRRILGAAPALVHAPGAPPCAPETRQRDVALPWAVTVARLVADARPDTPGSQIEAALNPIAYRCECVQCSHAVTARIQAVLLEWAAIKRTI